MNPTEIIGHILEKKRQEVTTLKQSTSLAKLVRSAASAPRTRGFRASLMGKSPLAIIAELKKASPSKGLLRQDFRPAEIAIQYERAGASALSVLTERHFFLGDPEFLAQVKAHVSLPLLRKDFLLDPIQIPESRVLGADAILLIVAFVDKVLLRQMFELAGECGLETLVEVHDEWELETALSLEAGLIGINNRNLKNLQVDLETTFRLKSGIESDTIVVAESGIQSFDEVRRLADAGINAILVGESLMRSDDIGLKLKQLQGVCP